MHLYRRGNIWWIEFSANNVKYRHSTHTSDKRAASAWMNAIKSARNAPSLDDAIAILKILYNVSPSPKTPISSIWPEYERIARAVGRLSISKHTIDNRKNEVERLQTWLASNAASVKSVEDVSGQVAALYAEHLASKVKNRNGSNLSAKTRRNIICHLSTVWGVLEKLSQDIHNPWRGLTPHDNDSQRLDPFSDDQISAILDAASKVGKDWLPVCVVAAHTGLRYGDVATLRWSSVDFAQRIISVIPNKTRRHGITVAIPFGDAVANALQSLPRSGDFLFPLHARLYGQRGRKVQQKLNFREVLITAGIYGTGRYTFHSFRHTCATKLARAGVEKDTRKLILGHTTDENAERYDHADHIDEKRNALEAANL